MRFLIFIFCFLFCLGSFAENWFPVGKEGVETVYMKKSKCEQAEGQSCFDVTNKDPRYHVVETQTVDDLSNPIMKAPYNTGSCDDGVDCSEKISEAQSNDPCDEGDHYTTEENDVLPGFTYYCTGIQGYEQIQKDVLVEDTDAKASVLAADQAKAESAQKLQAKLKDMQFGQMVIAKFSIKSDEKGLSSSQRAQLANDFETIKRLLEAGSIQAARDTIAGISPDGTLVTSEDKTELLSEIDAYLAQ